MPITYRQLKFDAVSGYRRHTTAVGSTSSAASTTTAFIDNMRQEPARYWSLDGADVWVKFLGTTTPSLNDGQVRRITGYSTNSTFVFAPAVTTAPTTGTGYQLFKGPHPDEHVGLAINEALRSSFPERVVSSIATLHEQEDVRTYSVASAVSSPVVQLKEIRRSVGTINSGYNFQVLRLGFDYELIDNAGATTLQLQYLPTPSLVLTFIGERPATELVADADTSDEPPAVILAGARHYLAIQEGNKELAAFWKQRLEEAKKDFDKPTPTRELKRPHFRIGF